MNAKIKKICGSQPPVPVHFLVLLQGGDGLPPRGRCGLRREAHRYDENHRPGFRDNHAGPRWLRFAGGPCGGLVLRLVVYNKVKNAKKFRKDVEYGSARWGTAKDIAPFVDPKFENNVILTGTEFLTMNTRPKIPANARNLNCCIIGSSGSGKTRFWLTPQLLQAHSSYVCVDPKGGVLSQVGHFLQKRKGYKIKVFNSVDFRKSMHYNPMAYIKTESDVLKFVNA